jgi:hypothetical protein
MSEKPKTPPADTDPIQSEKFREAVRDLEGAGELNPTDGIDRLESLIRRVRHAKIQNSVDGKA